MGSGAAATLSRPITEPEKQFKCMVCNRIFNKKANLKVHSRKHTGEKPYACSKPGCGRAFMWKSSVTFHEQNCPTSKKDKDPPSPMSVASKGVQKRPKSRSNNDVRTPQTTPSTKRRPLRGRSPPTTPMTPEEIVRDPYPEDDIILNSQHAHLPVRSHHEATLKDSLSLPSVSKAVSMYSTNQLAPMIHHLPTTPTPNSLPPASTMGPPPNHSSALSYPNPSNNAGLLPPPLQPHYGTPDGHTLPAPSTLLGEANKRMHSGGGRPPVIPGSLPKHFLQGPKDSGTKLFDLRVPSSPGLSGAKPLVMQMFNTKMPKMPIAMELDDSDDEGPVKIIGAQDAFMRTGNPFGGFAPQPRCSPLPVYSPIVCPGISPMPLSPLAPFSPLPPDSPAHNAPNPIHPPLNQTSRTNTNW